MTEDPVGVSRRGEDGEDEQPRQHDDGGGGLGGGLADEREVEKMGDGEELLNAGDASSTFCIQWQWQGREERRR